MRDSQRIENSRIRRTVLTLAALTVAIGMTAAATGHSELRPLRPKPVELRQLEAFLRTLSGPIAVTEPASARRTQ